MLLAAALTITVLTPVVPYVMANANAGSEKPAGQVERPELNKKPQKASFDPTTVLVKFKTGTSDAARSRVALAHGATRGGSIGRTDVEKLRASGPAKGLTDALRRDPAVEFVTRDYRRQIAAAPNDPLYVNGHQKYLDTLRFPQAWDRVPDVSDQVIAVIDTGVDASHPELAGRTVDGFNVLDPNSPPDDYDPNSTEAGDHGTHVAGIAAAIANNGQLLAGATGSGRVMPVKVVRPDGTALDSDVIAGITWAVDHGAKIINLSAGGPGASPALHDAIKYAENKGVVVVAAAGNTGNDSVQYPAAYPEVLAVGATDNNARLTSFSTYGDWVDVASPGFQLKATAKGGSYSTVSGTSYAAPLVASAAALVKQSNPGLSPAQVRERLIATARDAGPRGIDPYFGSGLVDAYRAVGGPVAPDFPLTASGEEEPNDVPERAADSSSSVSATIGIEGDVDWYRFDADRDVQVRVTPATTYPSEAQQLDPVLSVYDSELRLLGEVDDQGPGRAEQLAADLDPGTYYVAVRNFNGAAVTKAYTVQHAPSHFYRWQNRTLGSMEANGAAIGDVTGDGRNDVVLTTVRGGGNDLVVFPQGVDGTLGEPATYDSSGSANEFDKGVVILDANGDRRLDVAVATPVGVEIFLQQAAGTLDRQPVIADIESQVLTAGDLDSDGDTDLIVGAVREIIALLQQPDGTFVSSVVSSDSAREVEIGDLDGDGRLDIAAFLWGPVEGATVYHQTTEGWHRSDHPVVGELSSGRGAIEVADISGDDRSDLIMSVENGTGASLNVFEQAASGELAAPKLYDTQMRQAGPVEAADINGDGRLDAVNLVGLDLALTVMRQKSDGTLSAPAIDDVPSQVQGLAVGDISGDGKVDAVIAGDDAGLVYLYNSVGTAEAGDTHWIRSVSPEEYATGVARAKEPSVTFQRALDPASITSENVQLLDGRTGDEVPSSLAYDETTKTIRITPAGALRESHPYRIAVGAVRDTAGASHTRFSTTFATVNDAPPPVSGFTATGGVKTAALKWTMPTADDFSKVVVRMAEGGVAPSTPEAGTLVYEGTGTSKTVSGLAFGKTYSFAIWAQDRPGAYSKASAKKLVGTVLSATASPSTIYYGSGVKISGKLTKAYNGAAIPWQQLKIYSRRKGTTAWVLHSTTVKTSSTGSYSFTHRPTSTREYYVRFSGSTAHMGVYSPIRTVTVRR